MSKAVQLEFNFNPAHPSNAVLGNAPVPENKEPITWKRYCEERGAKYNPIEISGVVEADRRAEEIMLKSKGEQIPMHNYNVINDPQAYRDQQQKIYNELLGKGEQVPMHNWWAFLHF